MSFFFNGAQAQVTLQGGVTGTFPDLKPSQSIHKVSITATGGNDTIFTVPAGEKAYLLGFSSSRPSGTAVAFNLYEQGSVVNFEQQIVRPSNSEVKFNLLGVNPAYPNRTATQAFVFSGTTGTKFHCWLVRETV